MADQEFLASFGVEIDESGVERLQNCTKTGQNTIRNHGSRQ